jgi:hypothetical protein
MNLEQNLSGGVETKDTLISKEVEAVHIPSAEDLQAKENTIAANKVADQKRIDEIKNELMGKDNLEISNGEAYDIYSKWKELELQKISIKAKEMEGQKDSAGIGYNYNRQFNSMNLEGGGEVKFIEFASKEGSQRDINAALKLLGMYHRDRDDLKEKLLNKLKEL